MDSHANRFVFATNIGWITQKKYWTAIVYAILQPHTPSNIYYTVNSLYSMKKKQKQDRTWLRLQWPESQYCLHLLFILCIGYPQFRNPNSQLTRVRSSDHYIFQHICFSCFKCKLYSRLMRSFVIQKGYNILNVAKNKFSMSN